MNETDPTAPAAPTPASRWVRLLIVYPLVAVAAYVFVTQVLRFPKRGGLPPGISAPPLAAAGWLNGEPPSSKELAGQVVVIDAWFAACRYCRDTAPELVRLHAKYKDRGAIFIGLTPDEKDQLDESRAFLEAFGITWPNGYGAQETLDRLQVTGYPSTLVIGRDGTVVWNDDSPGTLDQALEQALAAK